MGCNPTMQIGVLSEHAARLFRQYLAISLLALCSQSLSAAILQMIVPFLIWGVVGVVFWRIYLEFNKHK
jgi:hypothetical protein